jgi:hypothetical protein
MGIVVKPTSLIAEKTSLQKRKVMKFAQVLLA